MMIIHKITLNLTSGSTVIPSAPYQEVGVSEIAIDDVIAASSTDAPRTISITAANLQSIWLLSSGDLTIKTNSSTSPSDTLHLKAGIPYVWSVSPGYFTAPFSTNVTAWYQTNGTAASSLKGRILTV